MASRRDLRQRGAVTETRVWSAQPTPRSVGAHDLQPQLEDFVELLEPSRRFSVGCRFVGCPSLDAALCHADRLRDRCCVDNITYEVAADDVGEGDGCVCWALVHAHHTKGAQRAARLALSRFAEQLRRTKRRLFERLSMCSGRSRGRPVQKFSQGRARLGIRVGQIAGCQKLSGGDVALGGFSPQTCHRVRLLRGAQRR